MGRLKGYRTIIVGGFLVAYAIADMLGIDVPNPDGEQAVALSGAAMLLLRFITSGPVGFKGEA